MIQGFKKLVLLLLPYTFGVPILPQSNKVQTGIVPIFGGGLTMQPITFTFTTPLAPRNSNSIKNFPTLRPYTYSSPVPPPMQNNQYSREFKYDVQMPTTSPNFLTTPVYSQALQYKAMQASLQQDAYSTYRTLWKQMLDTWIRMRNELYADGQVEQNWKMFWNKLAGTVEPYMSTLSNQFGKMINVYLKHQQDKEFKNSQNRFIQKPKRKPEKATTKDEEEK